MNRFLFLLPLILALFVSVTVDAKKKKYPNGDYYEGEWKKGAPDGIGKMIYANGNIYQGSWSNGQPNGHGTMDYDSIEARYEGSWENGVHNGKGKMVYANGNIYEGQWVSGKKSGKGKMTYWDKTTYEGNWEDDQKTGQGIYIDRESNIFTGTFKNGDLVKGKLEQPNGDSFEGEWKNNLFYNGKYKGTINRIFYDGNWVNGLFTGQCKIKHERGDVLSFDGTISNDKTTKGRVCFENYTYEGELKENSDYVDGFATNYIPSGKGCLSFSAKDENNSFDCIIDGTWDDGKLIQIINERITINNISYNMSLDHQYISIPYKSKVCSMIKISNYYSEIYQTLDEELKELDEKLKELEERHKKFQNAPVVELQQAGTILSHLPLEKQNSIEGLIVKGPIDETDLFAICKCKNLQFLDLSHANMRLSQKAMRARRSEGAYVMFVLSMTTGISIPENWDKTDEESHYIIPENAFSELHFLQEIKFPNNVRRISENVCKDCKQLVRIELPVHLETIESHAFENCTSLEEITFPVSLQYLGSQGNSGRKCAFYNCSSLKKVDLSKCTFWDKEWECDFEGCTSLKEFHLPKGIESINTFSQNKEMEIYMQDVKNINPSLNNHTLYMSSKISPSVDSRSRVSGCTIYIPKGSITSYYSSFGDGNTYKEK